MGASGKWFKSLVTLKPLQDITNQEKIGDNNKSKKKWKLWRSSSEGFGSSSSNGLKMRHVAASEASNSSYMADDLLAAAMATIIRAQPKDFRAVKREWAAIRIQTAFRGLLARRALRALRAVVRIQAIFRGRQVRNQAAVTLKCMQALVRVQAHVRSQCLISSEERTVHKLNDHPTKEAEKRWCDNQGTLEQVRAKQGMRQQGVMKRERAMAYAVSKQSRSYGNGSSSPNSRANMQAHHRQRLDWNWLDSWMATKPWEGEEDNIVSFQSSSFDQDSLAKNATKTRILAPSSESIYYDESLTSTSSASIYPPTTLSSNNTIGAAAGKLGLNHTKKPSYMNPTESIKAKQKTFRFSCEDNMRRHVADDDDDDDDDDDLRYFRKKLTSLSCEDTRSSADSNPSIHFSRELCRPRNDCLRNNQWHQGRRQ